MAGEGEAVQLLAELLHHVVAPELAVNEYSEADILPSARDRPAHAFLVPVW
jgi:hypothetical protein